MSDVGSRFQGIAQGLLGRTELQEFRLRLRKYARTVSRSLAVDRCLLERRLHAYVMEMGEEAARQKLCRGAYGIPSRSSGS